MPSVRGRAAPPTLSGGLVLRPTHNLLLRRRPRRWWLAAGPGDLLLSACTRACHPAAVAGQDMQSRRLSDQRGPDPQEQPGKLDAPFTGCDRCIPQAALSTASRGSVPQQHAGASVPSEAEWAGTAPPLARCAQLVDEERSWLESQSLLGSLHPLCYFSTSPSGPAGSCSARAASHGRHHHLLLCRHLPGGCRQSAGSEASGKLQRRCAARSSVMVRRERDGATMCPTMCASAWQSCGL